MDPKRLDMARQRKYLTNNIGDTVIGFLLLVVIYLVPNYFARRTGLYTAGWATETLLLAFLVFSILKKLLVELLRYNQILLLSITYLLVYLIYLLVVNIL